MPAAAEVPTQRFVQLKRIHVSRFRSSECKVEGLRLRKVVALAFPLLAMFEVGQPIVWEQPHAVNGATPTYVAAVSAESFVPACSVREIPFSMAEAGV